MTKKWIEGVVVNDKAAPGIIAVREAGTGQTFFIARNTNQRIVDAKKGIKLFELEGRDGRL